MKTLKELLSEVLGDSERFGYLMLACVITVAIILIFGAVNNNINNNTEQLKLRIEILKQNPLEENTIIVNGVKYRKVE